MILSLLVRRRIELFLNIGIRFRFSSFGILLGMAGPVIQQLLGSLAGDTLVQAWSCSLLAETLATADERNLKKLMSQGWCANIPPEWVARGNPCLA